LNGKAKYRAFGVGGAIRLGFARQEFVPDMADAARHAATRRSKVRKLLTIIQTGLAVAVSGTSLHSQIREVHDEYLFLPKAPAVPYPCAAPSLVGPEEAPDAARAH
jgi:hypothetical protein